MIKKYKKITMKSWSDKLCGLQTARNNHTKSYLNPIQGYVVCFEIALEGDLDGITYIFSD